MEQFLIASTIAVCGHTHVPGVFTSDDFYPRWLGTDYRYHFRPNEKAILNVGSVGSPAIGTPRFTSSSTPITPVRASSTTPGLPPENQADPPSSPSGSQTASSKAANSHHAQRTEHVCAAARRRRRDPRCDRRRLAMYFASKKTTQQQVANLDKQIAPPATPQTTPRQPRACDFPHRPDRPHTIAPAAPGAPNCRGGHRCGRSARSQDRPRPRLGARPAIADAAQGDHLAARFLIRRRRPFAPSDHRSLRDDRTDGTGPGQREYSSPILGADGKPLKTEDGRELSRIVALWRRGRRDRRHLCQSIRGCRRIHLEVPASGHVPAEIADSASAHRASCVSTPSPATLATLS